MNVIDRVKELLAAAEKHEHIHGRGLRPGEHRPAVCPSCSAELQLARLGIAPYYVEGRPTFPAARALVESQEALEKSNCHGGERPGYRCPRCAALRLDGLAEAMER